MPFVEEKGTNRSDSRVERENRTPTEPFRWWFKKFSPVRERQATFVGEKKEKKRDFN